MNRRALIQIRISAEEKKAIAEKAAACALSTSAFMRKTALNYELQTAWDQAAVHQLQRIGRNLNQAVRLMHKGDYSEEVKENLRRCLKAFYIAMGGEG